MTQSSLLNLFFQFPEAAAKYLPFIGVCIALFIGGIIASAIYDHYQKKK